MKKKYAVAMALQENNKIWARIFVITCNSVEEALGIAFVRVAEENQNVLVLSSVAVATADD